MWNGWNLFVTLLLLTALSLFALACKAISRQRSATKSGAAGEWMLRLPGGETICAGGTPYAFYTRQTGSDKLLIFFQGGGGCVAGIPCDPKQPEMFDPSVVIPGDASTQSGAFWDNNDDPAQLKGVFDLKEARNPFADYNMVYIPYCSADVHLGNRVIDGVHHKGFVNSMAALAWTFANIPTASRVIVAGSSAGGLAAPFYAGPIARHYTNAAIGVLSDSGGSYAVHLTPTLEMTGSLAVLLNEFGDDSPPAPEVNYETATLINAARFPRMRFARFDTTGDTAQQKFVDLATRGQKRLTVAEAQATINAKLRAAVANYHTYTVAADYHVILRMPRFYQESVNGVPFHKWVAAFANGEAVATVKE